MKQLTKEGAIALAESGWWKEKSAREVAEFQMAQDLLCMPFGEFHRCMEEALGRPVWTHEFADREGLTAELRGDAPIPENPTQHALDSLAAMLLAAGKDPDEHIIIVVDPEPSP